MSTSFYGVLGVGPDADERAIRAAYRERVTSVHPDVNDDPNADAQFRRLTTAKETLLDEAERARYDRIGHAPYVRQHVDCSAWSDPDPSDDASRTTAESAQSPNEDGPTDAGPGNRSRDDGERSQSASQSASDARSSRNRSTEGSAGRSTEATSGRAGRRSTTAGERTTDGGVSPSASAAASAWTDSSGTGQSADRTSRSSAASTSRRAGSGSGSSSYATSSFWQAQGPNERSVAGSARPRPLPDRVFDALRRLGPWLLVHVAFIAAAVGTCLYVYWFVFDGGPVPVALLFVLVGEVGLAVILSTIHVLSRLTR